MNVSRSRPALVAAVLLGLCVCAKADDATAAGPKILKGLTYKTVDGKPLGLDLYLPAGATQPAPLVILIHGGGWSAGTKESFGGPALEIAKKGRASTTIEYRLSNVAPFPAQIEDAKAAVRWLRAHASDYNLDADHIFAMGHSAGGHLAALLGTSGDLPQFDTGENLGVSSKVQGVIDLAGPVDLQLYFGAKPEAPTYVNPLFGGKLADKNELVALASPIKHIGSGTPPFLLISGLVDDIVSIEQPQMMAVALGKAGVPCQLLLVPGVNHGIDLNLPYGKGKLWDAVDFFLDSNCKKARP